MVAIVVHDILLRFENTESKIVTYADDLASTILGFDPNKMRHKMEHTPSTLYEWANNCVFNHATKTTRLLVR